MATTTSYSGETLLQHEYRVNFSADSEGSRVARVTDRLTWAATGGTGPTLSGWLKGTFTPAAGDILLAHATDPLQGMGDSVYSDGFTVAGSKVKGIWLRNNDATQSFTVARGALNGADIFDAAGDSITLAPGNQLWLFFKAGKSALTTGSNDKLTISVTGAHTTASDILVIYGA